MSGGGGITSGGTATINQSTLSQNSSTLDGGGIYLNGGTLALQNSIVASNTAPTSSNIHGTFTSAGTNLISGNALLAPLGNYGGPTATMPPLLGSPTIDGCTDGTSFATDQRGFQRPVGAYADIGAVEVQPPAANPPLLGNISRSVSGGSGTSAFQFTFTSSTDADFTVLTSTNVAFPLPNWTVLAEVMQVAPGQFQFADPQATNLMRFYTIRSP